MKTSIHDASARQHSGESFSSRSPDDARRDRLHSPDLAEVDGEIARLVDRSTPELRVPGGHCITPDRLRASVAISPSPARTSQTDP